MEVFIVHHFMEVTTVRIMVTDMVITIQLLTIAEEEIQTILIRVIHTEVEETITQDLKHTVEVIAGKLDQLPERDHKVRPDDLQTQELK
jgi:hypothetical protein